MAANPISTLIPKSVISNQAEAKTAETKRQKMITQELQKLLHTTPFRPVRIHVSDGRSYVVKHHDFFWIFPHKLVIAIPSRKPGLMENDVHISILHITAVEEIRPRT